jgi:aromatic ring-opening dioxygenase LigB subunit
MRQAIGNEVTKNENSSSRLFLLQGQIVRLYFLPRRQNAELSQTLLRASRLLRMDDNLDAKIRIIRYRLMLSSGVTGTTTTNALPFK